MTDDERSDADLLAAMRIQPELLAVLYERHAPAVYRFLVRRVSSGVAEDLLSEVFAGALAARKRVVVHDSGSALPWLYGIAGNLVRRQLRRPKGFGLPARDPGVDWDAVDARIDAQARRRQLRVALDALSNGERELLLLVAWDGLTPTEAATALGISSVAARSRLHRARARVQQALTNHESPAPKMHSLADLLRPEEKLT